MRLLQWVNLASHRNTWFKSALSPKQDVETLNCLPMKLSTNSIVRASSWAKMILINASKIRTTAQETTFKRLRTQRNKVGSYKFPFPEHTSIRQVSVTSTIRLKKLHWTSNPSQFWTSLSITEIRPPLGCKKIRILLWKESPNSRQSRQADAQLMAHPSQNIWPDKKAEWLPIAQLSLKSVLKLFWLQITEVLTRLPHLAF